MSGFKPFAISAGTGNRQQTTGDLPSLALCGGVRLVPGALDTLLCSFTAGPHFSQ